jgi:hypothetical protein
MKTCLAILLLVCHLGLAVAAGQELDLPSPTIPPFTGQRYEAIVPDTLDLAERMRLAINGLTRCVSGPPANPFPSTQVACNHIIDVARVPPKVARSVPLYGKYLLALNLARCVTGSEVKLDIDNDWRNGWLDWQRVNPVMHTCEGARRLEWLSFNLRREPEPNRSAWAGLAERAVERLCQVSVAYQDGMWIPWFTPSDSNVPGVSVYTFPPDDCFADIESALISPEAVDCLKDYSSDTLYQNPSRSIHAAWTVQGLLATYRATKNRESLELAGKLCRYLKDDTHVIAPNGQLRLVYEHPWPAIHWHHNIYIAMACAEYGAAANDHEFLDFADKVYQHVLTFCSREVGFAPEYCYGQFPRKQAIDNTESCCSADLILLALWLSQGETVDYWDDIDRYIRNHIATMQLTDTRPFYDMPENRDKGWQYPDPKAEAIYSPFVGHWAGWATANEWHDPRFGPGIQTCCIGNCTRALYYVWERMIDFSSGRLRVHLMLNRASAQADCTSYRPYEGKFEINLKADCRQILIRAPEWIDADSRQIKCLVDGRHRDINWRNRYVDLGAAQSGQTLTLLFPIGLKSIETEVGRIKCVLTLKGNTVIAFDPPGQRMPLYQRKHYRADRAPMVPVERYVSAAMVNMNNNDVDQQ